MGSERAVINTANKGQQRGHLLPALAGTPLVIYDVEITREVT
jgi:hypothetical protein